VDTVDPDLNVHILGASKQRTGTIQTLRSMAEMPGGLKLSKTSLAAQESCKAGADSLSVSLANLPEEQPTLPGYRSFTVLTWLSP